jgi:hypothetical protein
MGSEGDPVCWRDEQSASANDSNPIITKCGNRYPGCAISSSQWEYS